MCTLFSLLKAGRNDANAVSQGENIKKEIFTIFWTVKIGEQRNEISEIVISTITAPEEAERESQGEKKNPNH